jgi:stress response protein YsnF/sporulation protein YlmC with PRC-barrel domain
MTMQAAQLIGARVMGGDGQVVGTVQQIFKDDKDGTPVWARIRAGTRDLFVPLGGSRASKDGLSVPFDSRQILSSPDLGVRQHMSAAQTDQLNRHYGLTVPAQGGPPEADRERGRAMQEAAQREQAQRDQAQRDQAQRDRAQRDRARRGETEPGQRLQDEAQTAEFQRGEAQVGEDWLIRAEERFEVGTEMLESGRARLHKYVDVEPVEQTVHVFHEEYEIERVPISAEEQVRGEIAEAEQEIALHEARPVLHKEAVPVERVRLKVKRVDEDRTLRDEIRRERLEVEDGGRGGRTPRPAESARPNQNRS